MSDILTRYQENMQDIQMKRETQKKIFDILNRMNVDEGPPIDAHSLKNYKLKHFMSSGDYYILLLTMPNEDWDMLVEMYHSFDWQSKLETTKNSFENLEKAVRQVNHKAKDFKVDTEVIRSKILEFTENMNISTLDTEGNPINKARVLLNFLVETLKTLYLDFETEIKENKHFFETTPTPDTTKKRVNKGVRKLIKHVYWSRKMQHISTDALKLAEILVDYIDRLMAFAMIRHKRLGKDSPFRDMSDDITRIVTGH